MATVVLDNTIVDVGDVWTLSSNQTEVAATGYLEIIGSVGFECTAISVGIPVVAAYITVDSVELANTRRWTTISDVGKYTITVSALYGVTAGEEIGLEAIHENSGSTTATMATLDDGSSLILKLTDADVQAPETTDTDLGNVFEFETSTSATNTGLAATNANFDVGVTATGASAPGSGGLVADFENDEAGVYPGDTFKWNLGNMTVLFWVKSENGAGGVGQIMRKSDSTGSNPEWNCEQTILKPTVSHTTYDSDNIVIELASKVHSDNIADDTWAMIGLHWQTFVATGNRWRVGISINAGAIQWSDAQDATAPELTGNEVAQTGGNFYFNTDSASEPFISWEMQLDMYRQWYRELSATEISYHYNGGAGRSWPF